MKRWTGKRHQQNDTTDRNWVVAKDRPKDKSTNPPSVCYPPHQQGHVTTEAQGVSCIETMTLLFLSQDEELHTDWMEAECTRRGVPYFRLCPDHLDSSLSIAVEVNNDEFGGYLSDSKGMVSLQEITGVWYRRPLSPRWATMADSTYRHFVQREAREVIDGLYRALWDRRWVNAPHAERSADYKPYQLQMARRVGLKTPPTLITTSPDDTLRFFEACHGQMIYKPMSLIIKEIPEGEEFGIYTSQVTQEALEQTIAGVQVTPCLFQALIPKQYEVRVNVIGDYLWATAIDSQGQAETQVDYRHNTAECPHHPIWLPPLVEYQCLMLAHRLGLRMGNIDLIVTPDEEYIFLEINPNGQWAWIESQIGYPLATALVDELLGIDTLAWHPYRRKTSLDIVPSHFDSKSISQG